LELKKGCSALNDHPSENSLGGNPGPGLRRHLGKGKQTWNSFFTFLLGENKISPNNAKTGLKIQLFAAKNRVLGKIMELRYLAGKKQKFRQITYYISCALIELNEVRRVGFYQLYFWRNNRL